MNDIVNKLLRSEEACIRLKVRAQLMDEDVASPAMKRLRRQAAESPRVRRLLSADHEDDPLSFHPYAKWQGVHWRMTSLADVGYPAGDDLLIPWREQVYRWLLPQGGAPRKRPAINGRRRNCASQEGNAVYYLLCLGLADERTERLVRMLIADQWPDGGWNCDKKPGAVNSSYHESLIPFRALALHARLTADAGSAAAAERAAELFLKRRLLFRLSDGKLINPAFAELHYPPYWHYDVLFALKVMAEAGYISDPRCRDALDLLESKRLQGGTWPAEGKWYRVAKDPHRRKTQTEVVDWGPVGKGEMNEFVTADALCVLRAAARSGA